MNTSRMGMRGSRQQPFTSTSGRVSGRSSGRAKAAKRGVLILPGLGNSASDYQSLATNLSQRGCKVVVVPISRLDWLRNAAGLRDPNYWKGSLEPRPTVDWYLKRLNAAADALRDDLDGQPSSIVSHSAGGWLARVYLQDFGTAGFERLLSLGSPHRPLPAEAAGVIDQTRGILTFCENRFPGAWHAEMKYVTIAGRYIEGAPIRGEGTIAQKIAGAGYKQVCGTAKVWGDGIVPVDAAHLEGAQNIDIEGAYHSPLGASKERPWYGDQEILDQWVQYLSE